MIPKEFRVPAAVASFLIGVLMIFLFATETVSVGHEAAGARFGKVLPTPISEGFHFVNPLVSWTHFDLRNQSFSFDNVEIPTADQMISHADISIQYSLAAGTSPTTLKATGTAKRLDQVVLIPSTRSTIRTAARTLTKAEDLFNDVEVAKFAAEMKLQLEELVSDKGIVIHDVLVRNVQLPQIIATAIDQKKKREQEVGQQRAELERKQLEQQEAVNLAKADADAAEFTKQATIAIAQGEAEAERVRGQGAADAISKVKRQLGTESYNDYVRATRWDGKVPRISTGDSGGLFLQMQEGK